MRKRLNDATGIKEFKNFIFLADLIMISWISKLPLLNFTINTLKMFINQIESGYCCYRTCKKNEKSPSLMLPRPV